MLRDYAMGRGRRVERAAAALDILDGARLLDLVTVAQALGFDGSEEDLEQQVSPRGYRQLARIPRLPDTIVERLVAKFGSLPKILAASTESLQAVDGVGETRARSVREGLSRLSDGSLLERYS